MSALASQITSLTIVYSTVYSGADERKHQGSASLAFVRGIHWRPVNSPHKWPVTRKMFPFDDVIMYGYISLIVLSPGCFNLSQYHGCWCPGSLRRQAVSKHLSHLIMHKTIYAVNLMQKISMIGQNSKEYNMMKHELSWWRHQMETFSALLAICAGSSPVTGEFPAQRPVRRSFDVFFDLHLNKRLSEQWWSWWFETPSRPYWRHCSGKKIKEIWVVTTSITKSVYRLSENTNIDRFASSAMCYSK